MEEKTETTIGFSILPEKSLPELKLHVGRRENGLCPACINCKPSIIKETWQGLQHRQEASASRCQDSPYLNKSPAKLGGFAEARSTIFT